MNNGEVPTTEENLKDAMAGENYEWTNMYAEFAKVAKEELGMEKLTNKQIVYVTLPKKDYVESASEKIQIEKEKNIWQKILDRILNL